MPTPLPANAAPELSVETLGEERWTLSDQSPEKFTMIVFYRGLHCPVCQGYLKGLDKKIGDFAERGTDVIAVSGDSAERAEKARDDWGLENLTIGYGQDLEAMAAWDLYVSSGISDEEPERFAEPGLFLVDADGDVFYAAVNSMPFGRPKFDEMLDGIDFVTEQDYPPRGVVDSSKATA